MNHGLKDLILGGALFFALALGPAILSAAPAEGFTMEVKGMKNNLDSEKIREELNGTPGVLSSRCDHSDEVCYIVIDPQKVKREDLVVLINQMGYQGFLTDAQ